MASPGTAPRRYIHLLDSVRPSLYIVDLSFESLNAQASFKGELKASLEVLKPSKQLELHAKDMEFGSASVALADGSAGPSFVKATLREETETVIFEFSDILTGSVVLTCTYTGKVQSAQRGLYHCTFECGIAGASTHFEPVYCRYAVPCIDEPKAKACFEVSIAAPRSLTVVSNMPETNAAPLAGGLTKHNFMATPRVSSYLLGFSLGDYSSIDMEEKDREIAPVPMKLYAQRGSEEMGRFALSIGVGSLAFFEKFFDQKFPLPKLDLVVPPFFPIGGMENWGIITLVNRSLIDDSASLQKRQGVAGLVAHEVSHMWFGDLVTPCWWEDLWLKEGFASWVNLLPLDELFPAWRVWDKWGLDTLYASGGALEVDQYKATHAIEVPVNHPDEVQEIFDALSYKKGSAMVNMLFHSLGPEIFRQGLSLWLDKYKNSNSTTQDLWDCLATASRQPVGEIMQSWTRQEGFPVVSVTIAEDGKTWKVSQKRFSLTEQGEGLEPATKRAKGPVWTIPLLVRHAKVASSETVVMKETTIDIPAQGDFVILNAGVRAPMRVCYSADLLKLFEKKFASGSCPEELSPLDRVALASDGVAMTRARLQPVEPLLKLVKAMLLVETDQIVWLGILSSMKKLLKVVGKQAPALKELLAKLSLSQKKRLGWTQVEGEAEMDKLLRSSVLDLLGTCSDEETCREATERCLAHLCESHEAYPMPLGVPPVPTSTNTTKISMKQAFAANCPACGALDKPEAGVRGIALSVGLKKNPEFWTKMATLQAKSTNNEERDQLLYALGGHQDKTTLEQWVATCLDGSLPSQEWGTLFAGLSSNNFHDGLAWDLLVKHWDVVYREWGQSQFRMKGIVSDAMSACKDPSVAKKFFEDHPCDVAKLTIRQQLESMTANKQLEEASSAAEGCAQQLLTEF
mmetsp:Transcript_65960/g.143062  ORF Transcript_65960/g.143062 Transcript_65960/m.143062 type:complete len:913 (+) Transcript_65960:120-2858(+)|eukprot:CAMPEP_0206539912 /NCGR_PEP_ID=MMETSP0325_2-20121206/8688_1 /ASSEMBLY_ACC=CAM_ASM_000347 /TAXON_ID=2866 /ORGANISM="Crypthecodinium cohnii, Strain Seligo" /LENGTH=912 /DNA_ID=CAMNT_0054037527 /DNA_START=61 /DNA_END=2799 /DNA_ORIENTATION=+